MTEVSSGIMVQMKHVRMANNGKGYCMKGRRAWFLHRGLDDQAFRTVGLPVEVIEATGDMMALDVARVAREDHGR